MKKSKSFAFLFLITLLVSIIISGCSSRVENEEPALVKIEEIADNDEVAEDEENQEDIETLEINDTEPIELGGELSEETDELIEESIKEAPKEMNDSPLDAPAIENKQAKLEEKSYEEEKKVPEETPVVSEESSVKKNALKLEGKLSETAYTLDELKGMTDIIFEGSFYSLNNFGTTKHNTFRGVDLWKLISKNNIASDASTVSIVASDGYEMVFSIDAVKKQDYIDETDPSVKLPMIIAWSQDGEEFSIDEGAPYKLIIGQKEAGDVNKPQWVSNIDKILIK